MDGPPVIPETKNNLTIDQRVELVLELTRQLQLLEDLLKNARAKRSATEAEVSVAQANQAELEALMQACNELAATSN